MTADPWIPSRTMRAVSLELERAGRALTVAELVAALPERKPSLVRQAVEHLATSGHLGKLETTGHTATRYRRVALIRPYQPEELPWSTP